MSRALRRHHRARVIAHRARIAVALYYPNAWVERQPRGRLANEQALIGCGKARCFNCHPDKLLHRTADRMRAERAWRRDWGIA